MQKRLAEMGRKGQEDYEAKLQEEDFLKSMEEVKYTYLCIAHPKRALVYPSFALQEVNTCQQN